MKRCLRHQKLTQKKQKKKNRIITRDHRCSTPTGLCPNLQLARVTNVSRQGVSKTQHVPLSGRKNKRIMILCHLDQSNKLAQSLSNRQSMLTKRSMRISMSHSNLKIPSDSYVTSSPYSTVSITRLPSRGNACAAKPCRDAFGRSLNGLSALS